MSRYTTRICDRCRSPITDLPGSILKAEAGDVAKAMGEPYLDLCSTCSGLFLDWLRSGRQTHQDGAGEAIRDTAIASMELSGASV